jgi:hypothetical protein
MSTSGIRGKSVCVLTRRDQILVGPAFDPTRWIALEQFANGSLRLYPDGLFDLLQAAAN